MLLPNPKDALHKAWLSRLLRAIADDAVLVNLLHFKGGTCAALRGLLDRFSVDLDFEIANAEDVEKVREHLETVFLKLGLEIKDQSKVVPQYFLKYPSPPGERNTLQLDVTFPAPKSNEFEKVRLPEIDRIFSCHSIPTMVANKMVALMDRYEQHGSIAGRDLYDLHSFLLKGYSIQPGVIEERTGLSQQQFLEKLLMFIERRMTQTILDQDLNPLLPPDQFKKIRLHLKEETQQLLASFLSLLGTSQR